MSIDAPATIIPIRVESDVIAARQVGRTLAQRLGFSPVEQARITTAISELARNIVLYGVRGEVRLQALDDPAGRRGIEIVFADEGPGIKDVNQAMQQGYTSGRGLGAGLPGTQRLMDEFHLQSEPGRGVQVRVRKWR